MKELIQHIENLLPEHDCIAVPGLGGFVQNEIPAHIDSTNSSFFPASKEIGFNSRLAFNDGLLAQAYQQAYHISFEEANKRIRNDVQSLMESLNNGKVIYLGQIGTISRNEQGQIIFHSDNRSFFFPDSFGLTSFSYPTLKNRSENEIKAEQLIRGREKDEFIHIRMSRRSLQNFAIGAAACLFMLFFSKPVGNLPNANNQEAFMMHDYLAKARSFTQKAPENQVAASVNKDMFSSKTRYASKVQATENQAHDARKADIPSPNDIKAGNKASVSGATVQKSKRIYYIVISSFPEMGSAQKWLRTKKHKALFSTAGIIEKDGHARVYVKKFRIKKNAETYLSQFKSRNAEFASSWMFSAKND